MYKQLLDWLQSHQVKSAELIAAGIVVSLIAITSIIIHLLLHKLVLKNLIRRVDQSKQQQTTSWLQIATEKKFCSRIILIIQGVIFNLQVSFWLPSGSDLQYVLLLAAQLWVLTCGLLTVFSVLDILLIVWQRSAKSANLPLSGVVQGAKLIFSVIFSILIIAILINKSPLILFSGLGAMSAVTMLIFKDPILGFAAGLQLSANKMLSVGDWLEMPSYGADGDVIEIGLTTVKVSNWDKTISTVPTYALITNSFKNWRGMHESGGRRIKRSLLIDTTSIKFLTQDDLQRLINSDLLAPYQQDKQQQIEQFSRQLQLDLNAAVNDRKLINTGVFRAYLASYLRSHPGINLNMTLMVRQLAPTAEGLPLEIYAFTKSTAWTVYESVQADIFDHVFAVLPQFSLKVHQSPSGQDVRYLAEKLARSDQSS